MYAMTRYSFMYGVAMVIRLLQIIGLFCRISSLVYGPFAKEPYNFLRSLLTKATPYVMARVAHLCMP